MQITRQLDRLFVILDSNKVESIACSNAFQNDPYYRRGANLKQNKTMACLNNNFTVCPKGFQNKLPNRSP